eukprot:TRINITY_DN7943_c6_g1_i1.p1 TRINITY_DN7943_c6_g1~~TRINITY_DN7943_c6_g1_i1.p1  ORF type:complete len:449 (+),score=106.84 TRINITY_DN7943_c6_g1_i1:34-1347(+)
MQDPVWKDSKAEPLKLDSFRGQLIRQEETIIFALIERAQFKRNPSVYKPAEDLEGLSLLDFMMRETETTHAKVRRYTSPDETAFNKSMGNVKPILPLLDYPVSIKPNKINVNDKIKSLYVNSVLDEVSAEGDDPNTFGSSSVADITCLQALSKRIHFGKFIAEAKFQQSTEQYTNLIKTRDADGLMTLLTDLAVEEKVLNRVELKASTYGQDPQNPTTEHKVDPKTIRKLYKEIVMPITKEVQVDYLLQRLENATVAVYQNDGGCRDAALQHFGDVGIVECDSVDSVFATIASNGVAWGVVPFEDKKVGILKSTKLLLTSVDGIKITAETTVNSTRYLIIGKTLPVPSGTDKTALTFGVAHHSGALFSVLDVFRQLNINLTTIESLPQDTSYNFFLELQGHITDPSVAQALEKLKEIAVNIRHLGSYQEASGFKGAA